MGQMKVYCESDPLAKNVSVARLTFSNLLACVKNACKRRCAYIISSKKNVSHIIGIQRDHGSVRESSAAAYYRPYR
jgi:hypothetical protein